MKDMLSQELQEGDLIFIQGNGWLTFGLVSGSTPGGKIRYIYPEPEWNEDEEHYNPEDIIGYTIEKGGYEKSEKVLKITVEQMMHIVNTEEDFDEDEAIAARQLVVMVEEQNQAEPA